MSQKEKKQFVLRLDKAFKKEAGDHYDNEDLSTFMSEEVFEGYVFPIINDKLSFKYQEKKLLGYDVISHIDSRFYVRTINQGSGKHLETWKDASLSELILFEKMIQEMFPVDYTVWRNGILYKECIAKIIDYRINSIFS